MIVAELSKEDRKSVLRALSRNSKILSPLRVCVLISIIWVIGCIAIAFELRSDEAWQKPNSIGDFRAGMFAPLAFSWLVLAVFLQNKELQAQRDQLKQNGAALELQAKELNRSVGELEKQTQILHQTAKQNSESIRIQSISHYRLALAKEVMAVLVSDIDTIEKVIPEPKIDVLRAGVIRMSQCLEASNYSSFFFIYSDILHEVLHEDLRSKWISLQGTEWLSLHWFFGNTQSIFNDYFKQWKNIPGERFGDMTELHILGSSDFVDNAVEYTHQLRLQSNK